MRFRISDRTRLRISKKYLDWAETLPRFGGGRIAQLQMIREFQRKEAERTRENVRPPEGTQIDILYFRLFEMYQIEEFDQFHKALLRFMPGLSERTNKSIYEALIEFPSGDQIKWVNIGTITRERTHFGGFNHEDPNLPEIISRIRLGISRILPSIFVVTFDVHLTEKEGAKLSRLQSSYYLPEVMFFNLLPTSRFLTRSTNRTDTVMTSAIIRWMADLRHESEKYLQPLLSGFFSRHRDISAGSLPSTEVYAISGIPEGEEEFKDWEKEASSWYRSFGFNPYPLRYTSDRIIFESPRESLGTRGQEGLLPQSRVIVLQEPYLRSMSRNNYADEVSAIIFRSYYVVQDALAFTAILAFLDVARDSLADLQKLIFSRSSSRTSLKQSIRLNDRLSREGSLINVICQDFEAWKQGLGISQSDDLKQLNYVGIESNSVERDLISEFIAAVEYRLQRIQQQLSSSEVSFSNYVALRNMEAIFKLQRTAAWAAIVAAVIAALAILSSNWTEISAFVSSLLT